MTAVDAAARDWTRATAAEMADALAAGEVTSVALVQAHLDRIAAVDGADPSQGVHAFLHVNAEEALATAAAVDADRSAGVALPRMAGVPIAVKDVVVTQGMPSTAGSRILEGWIPPYDATVTRKIREARMPILGKTNMDEFAMGSSTEHSGYGPTRNPWDLERIPGGSGGGSAAALAAFEAPLAIGSDTGGSIRQPASVTATVGVKPTYGGVSRFGAIALASSLDQLGPCGRTVLDTALLHEVMGGHDVMDATSLDEPVPAVVEAALAGAAMDLTGVKVGVVKEISGEDGGFQDGVKQRFEESLDRLRAMGAETVEVSCPSFEYALAAYYVILPSEASSNLAKFDSVRFGMRVERETVEKTMLATRAEGFGDEVKRRIILGTYALSAGYYDAYYGSAQKVRTLVQRDFDAAFAQCDVLVSPTTPTTPFKIGERIDDPLAMYLNDVATIPANLAGIPGMSLPAGLAPEDGLPTGFQILAPAHEDARLYKVGAALEASLVADWGGPLTAQAPEVAQ
ncbi:Asp-tRNA(Asn)/Glu-tRNA(Gln) amidotransferase subunit GatA [Demequina lignilytica]|uniref:Glutamyl-tRNA(Gln) amidotransferase subunit A n=1 Tax=Demequina lignilytica TaxID=3051663 RepID=A0AB35MJV6_9MICO|nr:Asp-tRNA(Asn)/Glu-tRNA(Gln) amidotransferase subunit GatA [Demequina sp. SYSU T0a273]MDN4484071.1 Asp-tRNA(Asn)/Glu-tRNA(Gln) amidotransferase subunit GatA [Demequina sp. SYSU T0a273]